MTRRRKRRRPAGREVHVDQEPHPSTGETDLASLSKARGEGEGFTDILLFEIGKVSQQVLDAAARGNRLDNHANSHAHPSDAWLAAHDFRINGDAPQFLHAAIIPQPRFPQYSSLIPIWTRRM